MTEANPREWINDSRLWIVLDRAASHPRSLIETAELAIAGGVDVVLCRLKELPPEQVRSLSREIRAVCAVHRVPFVLSHFPHLAKELQADAVQLGFQDAALGEVREIVGPQMAIGYSTHGVGEAEDRLAQGADYVFLGPIFPTPAKLKYGQPLGLDAVRRASAISKPVIFIGGIRLSNVASLLELGAKRVAAIAALQSQRNPETACRSFKELLSDGS